MRPVGGRARLTIRARITIGTVLIASAVAATVGVVMDGNLARIARSGTVDLLRSDGASYYVDLQNGTTTGFDEPATWQYVVVQRPDGTTAINTFPRRLQRHLRELAEEDDDPEVTRDDGIDYVTLSKSITVGTAVWRVITAEDTRNEVAVLAAFRRLFAIALAVLVVIVGAAAWVLAWLSLRPVARLRSTAARISSTGEHQLLPVGRVDDEVSRLARTLNDLIGRLRSATVRERQLVSDASHELRTPVALLRTRLELADKTDDPVRLRAAVHDARRDSVRLSRLLDSMLELSSIEAGRSGTSRITVGGLVAEAADATERASFHAERARIVLETDPDGIESDGRRIDLDPEEVGRILDNLVANSIAAGPDRVRVAVRVAADPEAVMLRVSDDAGGLPPELAERALNRFTRGAGASRGSGAGLGLPIVAALVGRAGGTIALHNRPGDGLTVAIRLPLDREEDPGSAAPGAERA